MFADNLNLMTLVMHTNTYLGQRQNRSDKRMTLFFKEDEKPCTTSEREMDSKQ